jgi:hypothetical protein
MERVSARALDGWAIPYTVHHAFAHDVPVVLLHGLSQQRNYWLPVVHRMRSGPIVCVDQRGHGDSDADETADFSMQACAQDVVAVLDELDWPRAVIVGHSWGAAVALRFTADYPERTAACVLVDGGLWGPRDLGERAAVRETLRPPALGLPPEELWALVRSGELAAYWNAEVYEALQPTFTADAAGLVRTRIGMDRHMAVLDGLFEADPSRDLALINEAKTPLWVLSAEPRPEVGGADSSAWVGAREAAVASLTPLRHVTTLRMVGAIHDVPLQWPDLIAGVLDSVVATKGAR